MRESSLVRSIIKAVKAKYPLAYVRKLSDRHTRGLPDLVISLYCNVAWADGCVNQTLYVEAKTIYGKVGALQMVEANKIKRAGAKHIFARSPEEVIDKLEAMGASPEEVLNELEAMGAVCS